MKDNNFITGSRRSVLKNISIAGLSIGAFSGSTLAKETQEKTNIEQIVGKERKKFVQHAFKSYNNSDLKSMMEDRGYKPQKKEAKVARIQTPSTNTVSVSLELAQKGQQTASQASNRKINDEEELNNPSYIWTNTSSNGSITNKISVDDIREYEILPETDLPNDLVGYEFISDSKHEIDIFQTLNQQDGVQSDLQTQNVEQEDTLEHISINAKTGEIEKESTQVTTANTNSTNVTTQQSGNCNFSFSVAVAAAAACTSGCGGCWYSLLARDIKTFVTTCGPCAACSVELYCCVGAAAPDSVCSAVRQYVTANAANPAVGTFMTGIGIFFLDGCLSDGANCPA